MPSQHLGTFDVIVAGGGSAGATAAISAARHGSSTLLIDRLPFVGGTSTGVLDTFMVSTPLVHRRRRLLVEFQM